MAKSQLMFCSSLNVGDGVMASRDIGYRKDYLVRLNERAIIKKGTKGVICWTAKFGDLHHVRFDNGVEVSNIPSYCLEGV